MKKKLRNNSDENLKIIFKRNEEKMVTMIFLIEIRKVIEVKEKISGNIKQRQELGNEEEVRNSKGDLEIKKEKLVSRNKKR